MKFYRVADGSWPLLQPGKNVRSGVFILQVCTAGSPTFYLDGNMMVAQGNS